MVIVYKQSNNKTAILHLAENTTIEDSLSIIPEGAEYRVIDNAILPADEILIEFSEALQVDYSTVQDNCLSFDIDIAREITKDRLRKQREPLFALNDIVLRDAMIDADQEALINGRLERERLRNITMLADAANTITELQNITV